jgi:phosphoglycerate dehydrogenase-like enzyme
MDVHWIEPADPEDEIYRHPNVVALPHAGTSTHEVFDSWAQMLVDNITHAYEGRMSKLWHRVV